MFLPGSFFIAKRSEGSTLGYFVGIVPRLMPPVRPFIRASCHDYLLNAVEGILDLTGSGSQWQCGPGSEAKTSGASLPQAGH